MIRLILALTLSSIALTSAYAQYQWRDAKGRMVFSDMPPPHNIEQTRIIKGFKPKPRPIAVTEAADAAVAAAGRNEQADTTPSEADGDSKPAPKSTAARLAARLAEFDKRREQRINAKTETDQKNQVAARKKELCRNLHADNRALTSGMRLARVNENGEREIIDDKARSIRLNENKQLLSKHCA